MVAAAFALRLVAIESLPPGLYRDEAYYGLDAAGVLSGDLRLYFPANNGREPLFVYWVAGFVAMLGRTPVAVRLAAVAAGALMVAATYAMTARLFGRRAALLAAALAAAAPWPVILGRVGFRAGTLPLVLALAVAATARGAQRAGAPDRRWLAFGGALAGLSLYTYTAARLAPLAVLVWIVWWALSRRGGTGGRFESRPTRPIAGAAAVWAAAALLVASPLLATFAMDPEATLGRPGQVSIFAPEINGGDPAAALRRNVAGTLGMVFVRGDFIPRHNIPDRPIFGPLGGALWLFGAAVALRRRRPADGLVLVWTLVMALPTMLAENAPHFLRAAGMLPAVLIPPALGVDSLAGLAGRSRWRRASVALVAAALVAAELSATLAYGRAVAAGGPEAERLGFAFESAAARLAGEVNRDVGAGWQGGWSAADRSAAPPFVWLDRRLRDGWTAVPFLVDIDRAIAAGRLKLNDPYDPVFTTGGGVAYLMPSDLELERVWESRVPRLRVAVAEGPPALGDLDAEPRTLFVRVGASPAAIDAAPLARFADGMVLAAAAVRPAGEGPAIEVTAEWSAERPSAPGTAAFFQVLEGDRLLATSDAPPGGERTARDVFPPSLWRPGDRVVDRRVLALPVALDPRRHRVIAGLYARSGGERIPVVDGAGTAVRDHVVVWGGGE